MDNWRFKFRAWNKQAKLMVDLNAITPLVLEPGFLDMAKSVRPGFGVGVYLPDDLDIIVMQFTGLKDKNGVDIYEGDIFIILGRACNRRGPIIFEKGCFGYRDLANKFIILAIKQGNYAGNMSDIEVIGNRWESPQLLKEGV